MSRNRLQGTARTLAPTVAGLLALGAVGLAAAQSPGDATDLEQRVDQIMAAYVEPDTPGCAVGVIHQGDYLLKKGYGLANLEHAIPITGESVFRTGSVSKQFTAMAIALLAERGAVDLDADIHSYLPMLRDYGHKVTLRQMILHTAGMRDYEEDIFQLEGKPFRFGNEDYWTTEEFFERVKDVPLRHPPGERWEYSNLAYFLMSQVVEQVTGQSLRAFADQEIFGPLGMRASMFYDNVNEPVRNRADGYSPNEDGSFDINMTNLAYVGDGGVYSNLEDFIAWDQNFYRKQLGKEPAALMDQFNAPGALIEADGSAGHYAFGQVVIETNGETVYRHSGSWVGFRAYYERRPTSALSLVMFCNRSDLAPSDIGQEILAALPDK